MEDTNQLQSMRIVFGVHCLKIRHKGMYINPNPDPNPDEYEELYDSGCHWCASTLTAFGPDGQPVRPDICQGDRACCEL